MFGNALQAAIGVLALLSGLGAAAAYLTVGGLRGRVTNLQAANDDLRKDVADEQRRRELVERDLATATATATRDRQTIDHLRGEVATMRSVFEAVNGPIAELHRLVQVDHESLAAHHAEAMTGQAKLQGQMADVLRLLGSKREADGA